MDRDINELKANPMNPRTMDKHDFKALIESIRTFGDLSGIVLNRTTGQLVGGHQRIEAFKKLGGKPVITEQLEQPNSVGTIATGHVLLGDEKFAYREVIWEEAFETSANIAANRIQGQFDLDLLAELTYKLSQQDMQLVKLTGQTEDETKRLLKMVSGIVDEGDDLQDKSDEHKTSTCPNCNYQGSENEFRSNKQNA
jgi:hypothetical protein